MRLLQPKRKIYTLLISMLLLIGLTIGQALIQPIYGSKLTNVESLFEDATNMTIKTDQEVPMTFNSVALGTIPRDFDLSKKGVLLNSAISGASVKLSETFSGNFEMTFRAYSETSHHDVSGTDWNSSTTPMTPYADLKEITFEFTDEFNQTFSVVIAAGERWNTVTPAARVKLFNAEIGYHYANDATVPSDTALKNSGGYYTRIGGTSFANVALRNGLTSEYSKPVTFGFNQDTMEIYVMHYEKNTSDTPVYRVVLDLNHPDLGLRQLDSFDNYQVSIKMNAISSGQEGNIIIYDMNGQTLENTVLQNNIGPDLNHSIDYNGLINQKVFLHQPEAFDLIEGDIDFNGYVTVKNQEDELIAVYNSDDDLLTDSIFTDGAYFIPTDAGVYKISYLGLDSDMLEGRARDYSIIIHDAIATSHYQIEGNYRGLMENSTLGVNSTISLYPALVSTAMYTKKEAVPAKVTLLKEGQVYQAIDYLSKDTVESLTLNQPGNYQIVYSTPGFETLANQHVISFSVSDQVPVFTSSFEMPMTQGLNSVVLLPTMTASFNSTTKNATLILYGPSGERIALESLASFTPTVIGDYRLVYMANFGQTYNYVQYLTVRRSASDQFTSTSRTITIEANAHTGDAFPHPMGGILVTAGQENDTIQYSTVIDLTDNTQLDSLIDIMILPNQIGTLDMLQFTIKLTDIHNPKNFVNIIVYKGSWGNQWSYVKAGANNQMPAGWENGAVLTAYNTGTPVGFSFTGEANMNAESLKLYYDNTEKAVYASNIKRPGYEYGNQVIDFDDPNCFSERLLWEGFTTGEVMMSFSFQSIQSGSASVLIKSINGVDLSSQWLIDSEGPSIFIDTLGYEMSSLPEGEINIPYPLFEARAYDKMDGTIEHSVKVYKDYQTLNQTEYTVSNLQFTPTLSGLYSAVYRSVDSSGNTTLKVVDIVIVNELEAIDYQFEETLVTNEYVGHYVEIPKGMAIGGSGHKDIKITLQSPSLEILTLSGQSFLIEEVGDYQIIVSMKDYLGQEVINTYIVTSTLSAYPIINNISIPPIYLNGIPYQLPDFDAFDYFTNPGVPQTADKSIEVEIGGVKTLLGEDRTFTPLVSSHGETIKIYYHAKALGSDLTTTLTFDVHVLKVKNQANELDLSQFFLQDGISSVEAHDQRIDFMTITNHASIAFANPVIANLLRLDLSVPLNKNHFNAINIYLTDSQNPEIALKLTISKNSSETAKTSYISINDGQKGSISGTFYEVTSYGFSLQYNATSQYFIDLNNSQLIEQVKKTMDGDDFHGFPSGKVYVKYAFEGVTSESAISVVSIGNQVFSNDHLDRIRPQIQLSGFLPKVGEINESFVTPSAMAADILDPNVTLSLTIRSLTKVIYAGDIDEDYVFIPTEYGVYRFIYTAIDSSNRKLETTYLVTIKDRISPVITLDGTVPLNGSIDTLIALPRATVTDNNDTDLTLWIFVTTPTGELRALQNNVTSFTPKVSGQYVITYYCQDSYNAYTYQQYTILVP